MLKSLYSTWKNETAVDYNLATIGEAIDLTNRLNDFIVKASKIATFAHKILDEAGVVHRLTILDPAEAVELLADISDLRDELESQAGMLDYEKRQEDRKKDCCAS